MATMMPALREALWLNTERATAWVRIVAALSIFTAVALVGLTHGGTILDPWGHPLSTDFTNFWHLYTSMT